MKSSLSAFVACMLLASCVGYNVIGVGDSKDYKVLLEKGEMSLDGFLHYQTFDEFNMEGVGLAVSEPYVCVQRIKDTIVVVSSDTVQVRSYVRYGKWWYNHLEFDMDRKGELPLKGISPNPARVYDRFMCKDTVVEYKTYFWGNVAHRELYVKTKGKCDVTPMDYDKDFCKESMISYIQAVVDAYNKGALFVTRPYIFKERKFTYVLKCDFFKEMLVFKKNSLGLWGVQPGFDEYDRCLSIRDKAMPD